MFKIIDLWETGLSRNEKQNIRVLVRHWLLPISTVLFVLHSVAIFAAESELSAVYEPVAIPQPELSDRRGVTYENDFFVPGGRDQDYTFGLTLSYSKTNLDGRIWHQPLKHIDVLLGLKSVASRQGFEGGFYGFTPADKHGGLNTEDRPFASLVYFATSQERIDPIKQRVVRTQISYGVLGLDLVGEVQEEFHAIIGNDEPQGWNNQISDGGELTARYSISARKLLTAPSKHFELRETRTASVGYLTEASWGLSMRAGNLNSSWHEFNPDVASYAESSASANRDSSESFFWGGVAIKARAYNAFLLGQFKDSVHKYNASDLNYFIFEAYAGYTKRFSNNYFVSYGLRGHSSEVKDGVANRSVLWGGIMISRKLD